MCAAVHVEEERALLPEAVSEINRRREDAKIKEQIVEINTAIHELTNQRIALVNRLSQNTASAKDKKRDSDFVGRACPADGCRGFLSTQWKCGVCSKWSCPECYMVKGDSRDAEHTCDPGVKESVKLLVKDTKPCPKCAMRIHKIDGCDQMWCTQCQTGFSWRRGTIERNIHNPHYFEWQRANGYAIPRARGDVLCGRTLTEAAEHSVIYSCLNILGTTYSKFENTANRFNDRIRKTIHLNEVDGRRFRTNMNNLELRIRYLNKECTDAEFASKVHAAYKAQEKKRAIADVISFQVQSTTDIMYRLGEFVRANCTIKTEAGSYVDVNWCTSVPESAVEGIHGMLLEFDKLTAYSNMLLEEHAVTYGGKTKKIEFVDEQAAVLN